MRGVTSVTLTAETDGAVLVHCEAGKDRTGVVVAALLRAVGVCRAAIIEDYRATEPALSAIFASTRPS
jgi:protein-tyrosine phosphatase